MADTDQKDSKYGRRQKVKKETLKKKEIQQINFKIIRDLWRKFGARPIEELYDITDVSKDVYYQVTSGNEDANYKNGKRTLKIKDLELQKYFYGEQLIDIGISEKEWGDFVTGYKAEGKENEDSINKKIAKQIQELKIRYKLPMVMRPRDSFEHLLFLCKYGRECPEGDLKLLLLYDIFNDLSEREICECKDEKLLESILEISKGKLRDIETVYRCIELIKRKNKG